MIERIEAGEWDPWPLTRLLTVGLVFGLVAHFRLGWNPHLRDLWALPGGLLTIFLSILLLSSALAHVCLVVVMAPLCGIILCNDWFYDFSHWVCRAILRIRSARVLAFAGLCGEVLFFLASGLLIHRIALHL